MHQLFPAENLIPSRVNQLLAIYQATHGLLNLETAVRDGKVMQNFESELVPTEGNIPQMVKGPSVENDSGSKDCVNLPSPTDRVEEQITRAPPSLDPVVHN